MISSRSRFATTSIGFALAFACSGPHHPGPIPTASFVPDAAVPPSDAIGPSPSDAPSPYDVPPPPQGAAVAYQIDAAHSGAQPDGKLSLPLARKWNVDLGGATSFPCVVDGRVFVSYALSGGGGFVVALDAKTGKTLWGPADAGGSLGFANITYGGGKVVAMNSNGQMTAFDAATGNQAWTVKLPDESDFDDPPTAWGGDVYTGGDGSGGWEYAVRIDTGALDWMFDSGGSDQSSPAVGAEGVFFGYACGQDWSLDPISGKLRWHNDPPCDGGGGATPVLYGGKAYFRDFDGNIVFDAATGANLGTFTADYAPAFHDGVGYYVASSILTARPIGSSTPTWTFRPPSTDEKIVTAPIVVGAHVVVGTDAGNVFVISTGGLVESTDALPSVARGAETFGVRGPLPGLIAGDDMLFVPTEKGLAAY